MSDCNSVFELQWIPFLQVRLTHRLFGKYHFFRNHRISNRIFCFKKPNIEKLYDYNNFPYDKEGKKGGLKASEWALSSPGDRELVCTSQFLVFISIAFAFPSLCQARLRSERQLLLEHSIIPFLVTSSLHFHIILLAK